jgi:Subtilase family
MSPHKSPAKSFEIQASHLASKAKKSESATPAGQQPTAAMAKRASATSSGAQVAHSDPYFVWAQNSGARRLGRVTVAGTDYLQVAIEISGGEGEQRRPVFAALKAAGMKARKAYWGQSVDGEDVERFITALVDENRMADFVEAVVQVAPSVQVRFELGHPLIQRASVAKTRYRVNKSKEKKEAVRRDKPLMGKVIAVIDYGCPFAHVAFLDSQKKSRVRYVWLQDTSSLLPGARYELPRVKSLIDGKSELFPYGVELRPSLFDDLLAKNLSSALIDENACYEAVGYDLMREATTHGAHVLSIAASDENPLNDSKDWASDAQIIFVQLPRAAVADASGGSMNCHVIDALRYIQARTDPSADVVVNMSFGTHAGSHDGTSLLERAIDHLIERRSDGKFKVVIPAGNSFNAACHAQLRLPQDKPQELHWEVMPDDLTDSFLEIWYGGKDSEADQVEVEIQEPFSDTFLGPVKLNHVASWYGDRANGKNQCKEPACTIVHTESSVRSDGYKNRVALFVLAPTRNDEQDQAEARYGVWKIRITNKATKSLVADAWIERDDPILDLGGSCRQSRFVVEHQEDTDVDYPTNESVTKFCTLNSYATAKHVQTVGAAVKPSERAHGSYAAVPFRAATYSSAGPGRDSKKDPAISWVAYSEESDVLPGINAAGTRSRYWVRRDGTSVAAPQVTRALMNEMSVVGPPVSKPVSAMLPIGPDKRPKLQRYRSASNARLIDW